MALGIACRAPGSVLAVYAPPTTISSSCPPILVPDDPPEVIEPASPSAMLGVLIPAVTLPATASKGSLDLGTLDFHTSLAEITISSGGTPDDDARIDVGDRALPDEALRGSIDRDALAEIGALRAETAAEREAVRLERWLDHASRAPLASSSGRATLTADRDRACTDRAASEAARDIARYRRSRPEHIAAIVRKLDSLVRPRTSEEELLLAYYMDRALAASDDVPAESDLGRVDSHYARAGSGWYPLYFRAAFLARYDKTAQARAVYGSLEGGVGPPESRAEILFRSADVESDAAAAEALLAAAVREAKTYSGGQAALWRYVTSCKLAWAARRAHDSATAIASAADCAALETYAKDRGDERLAGLIGDALDDVKITDDVRAIRLPEPLLARVALDVADLALRRLDLERASLGYSVARRLSVVPADASRAAQGLAETSGVKRPVTLDENRDDARTRLTVVVRACLERDPTIASFDLRLIARRDTVAPEIHILIEPKNASPRLSSCLVELAPRYLHGVENNDLRARLTR